MRPFDDENSQIDLEIPDQEIIEQQAVRFAREFSALYRLERKKREELEMLASELKERNEELMDIVFLTSNHFLDPIKKIASNIEIIKNHADSCESQVMECFGETEKSVGRLKSLVRDMSKLYKIKSLRSLFRPVSLNNLLREVIEDLETTLKRKKAVVEVDELPELETDSVQARILFNQLIMLGISHKRNQKDATLLIKSSRNFKGFWRISLLSQGICFEGYEYTFGKCSKLNRVVRRLDLCQRISRRLGGFLYGEKISESAFSYHVILPEKNIPTMSQLKSHIAEY